MSERKPTGDNKGLVIFWAVTIAVVLLGPLAIWLYRLALGL